MATWWPVLDFPTKRGWVGECCGALSCTVVGSGACLLYTTYNALQKIRYLGNSDVKNLEERNVEVERRAGLTTDYHLVSNSN